MSAPANSFLDHRVLARIRAEYLEMPGMKLTGEQLQRLCGIDEATCTAVLDSLVNGLFLCRKSDGTYIRLTEGVVPSPRPAKATRLAHVPMPIGRRAS
jgi:hypothetical protein